MSCLLDGADVLLLGDDVVVARRLPNGDVDVLRAVVIGAAHAHLRRGILVLDGPEGALHLLVAHDGIHGACSNEGV